VTKLKASEFEGKGPEKSGVFGQAHAAFLSAAEKLSIIRRTEQDAEGPIVDLSATPDKWKHGGIESVEDIDLRS